jgi:predicted AlkP superfamily pyrophosphatase or phosphodiesterase
MKRLLVLDVVGLTPELIGDRTPHLRRLAGDGFQAELQAVLPAVTCSAQSSLLTGTLPRDHGIVGNGWYFRDISEILFWRQSNRLVQGEKVWEAGRRRDSSFTCAKLFWWYNMYASVDWSITPRPVYPADGRKIPSVYTQPAELKGILDEKLGTFPLFHFWGPGADILSSEWIGEAARIVLEKYRPTLTLVYLPHLDYDLQRHGPVFPDLGSRLSEVDRVAGKIVDAARSLEMEVVALSEYGITPVRGSISVNRILRKEGFLATQRAMDWELLDAGASRAFAVCDHQVAHVYVDRPENVGAVKRSLEAVDGIDLVLDGDGKKAFGLDHPRSGELVLVARKDRWFDYYYWLDDLLAPDFARTVDIHRKPGYDPVELFLDPARRWIKARILGKLARKALGFRYLMDVVPLDTSLVKGSHGRLPDHPREGPVFLSSSRRQATSRIQSTEVKDFILREIFGP